MFLSNLLKCMSRCQNRKNYRVPSFLTRHSVNLPSISFPRRENFVSFPYDRNAVSGREAQRIML